MTPLRLGVWCAIFDGEALLLSKRGDLNVWALPGGRLDAGETLAEAAAREVAEETGLEVDGLRPAGLYYLSGWGRLNVLFMASPSGGALVRRTDETRDNRFFPMGELPPVPLRSPVEDAVAGQFGQTRTLRTSRIQMLRLRARFAARYIGNALRGRPEPAFAHFAVSASALVIRPGDGRVLTIAGSQSAAGQMRTLPRITATDDKPPWEMMSAYLSTAFGVEMPLRWAGLWHDPAANALELVFAGEAAYAQGGEWTAARLAALEDRDAACLAQIGTGREPWMIAARASATHDRALPDTRY